MNTFNKNTFNTCLRAFYDEIKASKKPGNPIVVIYRYNDADVKFNPRGFMKVGKNSVIVGQNKVEIPYNTIRGLDFYFAEDAALIERSGKKCEQMADTEIQKIMVDNMNRKNDLINQYNQITGINDYTKYMSSRIFNKYDLE